MAETARAQRAGPAIDPEQTPVPEPGPLIQFGIVPFASVRQRPQQLALELARHLDVLYVDPPYSFLSALVHRRFETQAGDAPLPDGLSVLEAQPVLPGSGRLPLVNRLNYASIAARLRRALAARRSAPPRVLLVSFPKHLHALPAFPGVPVCYDVMDDYPLFFRGRERAVLARMHEALLRRADLVVVASRTLGERCRAQAQRLECISNGVGEQFVAACRDAPPDARIAAFPAPRLGFVGSISWWFDFEAVHALAAALPQASILLVGPLTQSPPPLPPNVHLLGSRPHAALPGILRAFDAGLIPLRRLPMIECANQVKLYEYLAAGLPVVATSFAEMRPFAALVHLCDAPSDWPEAVGRALAMPSTAAQVEARLAVAAGNLWSEKARALLAALEGLR